MANELIGTILLTDLDVFQKALLCSMACYLHDADSRYILKINIRSKGTSCSMRSNKFQTSVSSLQEGSLNTKVACGIRYRVSLL